MLYWRAENVTLRAPPPRRSLLADPERKKLWIEAVARAGLCWQASDNNQRRQREMPSSTAVLKRMDQRVGKLTDRFDEYVRVFGTSERFTGPSGYFHRKALALRAQHQDIASLLKDDAFFDAVYATLTAWGMHRMGPGNTRLLDLVEIRDSIRAQAEPLQALASLDITTVSAASRPSVVEQTWSVLTALRVSVADAQIVANSKALHHLLPAL